MLAISLFHFIWWFLKFNLNLSKWGNDQIVLDTLTISWKVSLKRQYVNNNIPILPIYGDRKVNGLNLKLFPFFQCSLKFRFQTQNKCCYFVSHGKSTIETTCPYWKIEKFYSWRIKSSNIPYNIRPIFLIFLVYLYLLIYVGLAFLGSNVPMEVIWTCIHCVFFFYSE